MTTRTLYFIALALLAISLIINVINGFAIFSTILTGVAVATLGCATYKKVWKISPRITDAKAERKL